MPNVITRFWNSLTGRQGHKPAADISQAAVVPEPVPSVHAEANIEAVVRTVVADEIKQQVAIARAQTPVGVQPQNPWTSILNMGQVTESPFGAVHFDNPIWYSTPQSPKRRPGSWVTVEQLRTFADNYDVLRSCIQHLKREVGAVPIEIVARNRKTTTANASAIKQADLFFSKMGGLGGIAKERSWFENALLEDLMVVGVATAFYHPTKSGAVYQIVELDASTIRPRMDAFGWPGPGEYKYEQWILGLPWASYRDEQIAFMGMPQNTRSYSPYPASPVEWLINVVRGALSADLWNLSWLTDGSTPSDLVALPEDWTVTQIQEFEGFFNAMMGGNTSGRQKMRFVPGGSQKVGTPSRKDQEFSIYEMWLLRRTCSIMGVAPASIGYSGEQYKESQGASMRNTSAFGAGVLLGWRKEFYDDVLQRIGLSQLEVINLTDAESSPLDKASVNNLTVGVPYRTINDARREDGLDPVPDGDQILVPNNVMTLKAATEAQEAPAAPPDPEYPANPADGGAEEDPDGDVDTADQLDRALGLWRKKAENRLKQGKSAACAFVSERIPEPVRTEVLNRLVDCRSAGDIQRAFTAVKGD